jgi:hypothetical protein
VCCGWRQLVNDVQLVQAIAVKVKGRGNQDDSFLPRLRAFTHWALMRAAPHMQRLTLQLRVPHSYSDPDHAASYEGVDITAEVVGLLVGCGASAAAAGGTAGLQEANLQLWNLPTVFRGWASALGGRSLRRLCVSVRLNPNLPDPGEFPLAVAAPLHGLLALQELRLRAQHVAASPRLPPSLTKLHLQTIGDDALPAQVR